MLLLSHKVFVCQVIATNNKKLEWCEVGMVCSATFFHIKFRENWPVDSGVKMGE
jgi:hypothetical protein